MEFRNIVLTCMRLTITQGNMMEKALEIGPTLPNQSPNHGVRNPQAPTNNAMDLFRRKLFLHQGWLHIHAYQNKMFKAIIL